jgi:hypothetical protein
MFWKLYKKDICVVQDFGVNVSWHLKLLGTLTAFSGYLRNHVYIFFKYAGMTGAP